MKICQFIILFLLVVGFINNLWTDFHGREAKAPYGFSGAVATVIICPLLFWVHLKAGAFSLIWP